MQTVQPLPFVAIAKGSIQDSVRSGELDIFTMVCVLGIGTCKIERINALPLEEFQAEISRKVYSYGLRGSASNDFNQLTNWSLEVQGPMRKIDEFMADLERCHVIHEVREKVVKEHDGYSTPDNFVFITWE